MNSSDRLATAWHDTARCGQCEVETRIEDMEPCDGCGVDLCAECIEQHKVWASISGACSE